MALQLDFSITDPRSNLIASIKKRWEDSSKDEQIYVGSNGSKSRENHRKALECFKEYWRWYGNVKYYDGPQYCEKFNGEFKERVRAYRGRICFECGVHENGRKLHIHHVHYDKAMCCNGSPQDVVPLCHSCHMKTNGNRDYWEEHFTELIYKSDPEGKCFFTKDEMKAFQEVE